MSAIRMGLVRDLWRMAGVVGVLGLCSGLLTGGYYSGYRIGWHEGYQEGGAGFENGFAAGYGFATRQTSEPSATRIEEFL